MDRLSVALMTGDGDFNRAEVERLRGPYLSEVGVRTHWWGATESIRPCGRICAATRKSISPIS